MTFTDALSDLSKGFEQLNGACATAVKAFADFGRLFEDRDKHYAVNEGQWPDKYVVLNRFMRTGLRPPFIFND